MKLVQTMKSWIVPGVIYAALALLSLFNSCQTAPIIQSVDVTAEKARVDKSANILDEYATGRRNHNLPGASEDFQRAGDDLRSCGAKLLQIQDDANSCATNARKIQGELDRNKSELVATKNGLSELQSKARASWWDNVRENWMIRFTWLGIGIAVTVGIQIALWFMGLFAKIGIGRVK